MMKKKRLRHTTRRRTAIGDQRGAMGITTVPPGGLFRAPPVAGKLSAIAILGAMR